ncbi:hypothetical protein DITRI_Ditri10aG0090100 [Diplodiscus trichospermus]
MASNNVISDVLFEILSRVELKTLKRCRLVSRECNSLTYDSSFMRLHCQRTETITGYFIQSLRFSKYNSGFFSIDNPDVKISLDFISKGSVEILAVAPQGLIFCMDEGNRCHYICKPSSRQLEIMPSPNPSGFTILTGMVVIGSNPLRFKVVRLLKRRQSKNSHFYWDFSKH